MPDRIAATARFFADGPEPALRGGYSPASGKHHFPLAETCPYSGAEDIEAVTLPRTGKLRYWTVVNIAPPGYAGPVPYGMGVVALDGIDLLLIARLDATDPAELSEGEPMELAVEALPAGDAVLPMWRFRKAGGAA